MLPSLTTHTHSASSDTTVADDGDNSEADDDEGHDDGNDEAGCWQAEAVFTALRGEFEQLFAVNHIGVLVQLADACHRLNTKQSAFIKVSLLT